jgi:hypothetical protein
MALVLNLTVGDVVDIADYWVAVLSIDSGNSATLITRAGQKIPIDSKYQTEFLPNVWVQLGTRVGVRNVKLLIDAPKSVFIKRRRDSTASTGAQAKSIDQASTLKPAKSRSDSITGY